MPGTVPGEGQPQSAGHLDVIERSAGPFVTNTMSHIAKPSLLLELVGRELAAVTFVMDYVQLLFGGPVLNLYVWPRLRTPLREFEFGEPGYRDALCARIGQTVREAADDPEQELRLTFADESVITMSLRPADRVIEEAAMLQIDGGLRWEVW